MNIPSLLIFSANCVLYFFIGHSLSKKTFADPGDGRAWRAYKVWWYGMSASTGLNGLLVLLVGAGVTWLPGLVLISTATTLTVTPALWGLLTYLLYIFRGNHHASRWLAVFYGLFGLMLLISIYLLHPIGARMNTWEAAIIYQNVPQGLFGLVYGVMLVALMSLPPILASFGMFSLYFRVHERSSKFRALLVPLGFFALFGMAYFIPLLFYLVGIDLNAVSWWPLTIRLIGIAALGLIYIAYFPPRWLQQRLHVSNVLA